jgi:hypothetical protein
VLPLAARRGLSEIAIHDLVDGVDRFPFTGTATKDEDARDEVELCVIGIAMALDFAVLAQDDSRDAHGLPAVAAQDTASSLR